MRHRRIRGDCLRILPKLDPVDLVIADPPYEDDITINEAIRLCKKICKGPMFFFMYAEDIYDLKYRPDQVLFWMKPPSTKNTTRRYSRFVEVICCYHIHGMNPDTFWYSRSGVFTDTLVGKATHEHEKPVSLMERLLAVNGRPGGTVLDPFAGSEAVRKAAERIGMRSISIDKAMSNAR